MKPAPTPPSPDMKPEPRKLIPLDDYPAMREALSENAKSALRWVEKGIADDPDPRPGRYQYPMSKIIVDMSADNLAVSYFIQKDGSVALIDVQEARRF